ncbi:MAG TPA: ABC transporter permease, partial [Longimicrobiales bacterium]|nr:ABC transporter permease [Longimicrobiales bacterium]
WMDFSLGTRSVALAGLLAPLALAVAALPSALRSWRTDLDPALRLRPHGGGGGGARFMTWALGFEVALSCFLLAVSSAVVQDALAHLRTGADFPTQGVLTGRFVLEPPGYAGADQRRRFFAQLREALRSEPSVVSASLTSALPGKEGVVVPAGPAGGDPGPQGLHPAQLRSVDPAFFPALGVSAAAGRLFSDGDDAAGEPVAVVNEAFVRRYGMAEDAPGRRIVVGRPGPGGGYAATVVGVVDDRGVTPRAAGQPAPGVYLPLEQVPPSAAWLVVRTRSDASLFDVWQRAVAPLDPYLPLGDVLTLDETLRRGHGAATLFLSVFLGLGGMTLLVALVGLHGVHSFVLARRVREIGVRRALGARRGQVLREGVRRGLRPVWAGALLGATPGFWVARAVLPVETGVRTWVLAPALLVLASLIAVWRPTRRASRADPMEVLRES